MSTSSLVVRSVLISCFLIHSAFRLVDCNPIPPTTDGTNDTEHEVESHEIHRYHVAKVDFGRVADPFIITGWILLASIAKIGKPDTTLPFICANQNNHCSMLLHRSRSSGLSLSDHLCGFPLV